MQVLHVLLQLLVVFAIILSFKFYYMFYFTCDRCLNRADLKLNPDTAPDNPSLVPLAVVCCYVMHFMFRINPNGGQVLRDVHWLIEL